MQSDQPSLHEETASLAIQNALSEDSNHMSHGMFTDIMAHFKSWPGLSSKLSLETILDEISSQREIRNKVFKLLSANIKIQQATEQYYQLWIKNLESIVCVGFTYLKELMSNSGLHIS